MVVCPKNKIINPSSGRCVLRSGKIGKEILGEKDKPREKTSPREKPKVVEKNCHPKILNPKTKRCVSPTGKIGKEILQKNKSPLKTSPKKPDPPKKVSKPKKSSPKKSESIVKQPPKKVSKPVKQTKVKSKKLTKKIILPKKKSSSPSPMNRKKSPTPSKSLDFTISKKIDDRGRIFLVNMKDGRELVLKKDLQKVELSPFNDKEYTDKYDFLPKIYSVFTYEGKKAMLMEKLDKFEWSKLKNPDKQTSDLLRDLKNFQNTEKHYTFDLSEGNIAMRKNGEIVLFDLWSTGTSNVWEADSIEGNEKTLINILLNYKYQRDIKQYVKEVVSYVKDNDLYFILYKFPPYAQELIENYNIHKDSLIGVSLTIQLYSTINTLKDLKKDIENMRNKKMTLLVSEEDEKFYKKLSDTQRKYYKAFDMKKIFGDL